MLRKNFKLDKDNEIKLSNDTKEEILKNQEWVYLLVESEDNHIIQITVFPSKPSRKEIREIEFTIHRNGEDGLIQLNKLFVSNQYVLKTLIGIHIFRTAKGEILQFNIV